MALKLVAMVTSLEWPENELQIHNLCIFLPFAENLVKINPVNLEHDSLGGNYPVELSREPPASYYHLVISGVTGLNLNTFLHNVQTLLPFNILNRNSDPPIHFGTPV